MPLWLQRTLAGSLILIMVLMPFHAFISTWGGTAIGPLWLWKSWKEILLGILMILVIAWLSANSHRWKSLAQDKLFWLIVAFVGALMLISVYFASVNGRDATAAGFAMDTRYLLVFGIGYVLFRFGKFSWPNIRRNIALFLITAGTIVAAIGLLQVWVLPADFLVQFGYDKHLTIAPYVLIDENPDALRAFATLRGPNDFGAFLILPLMLSVLFAHRNKWFICSVVIILAGIFASGARSAWIGAIVSLAMLAVLMFGGRVIRSRNVIGIAVTSVAAIVIVGLLAVNIPAVRLAVFHSSPGDSSLTEGSTDQHWAATMNGVQRVVDRPLGCGAGCAGPASYYSSQPHISENYYVQIAEEVGVIGLGLWIAIIGIIARRLWQRREDWLACALLASFAGLSVIGFWLHVWSDDPLSLTVWAVTGAILGYYARAYPNPLLLQKLKTLRAKSPKHEEV